MNSIYLYNKVRLLLTILVVSLLLSACNRSGSVKLANSKHSEIVFHYAKHIKGVKHQGYTVYTLQNPWHDGKPLHTYVLVARKDSARVKNLPQGTVIYTPVERSVVFTSPHCYLFSELGAGNAITGVCDAQYINVPIVRQALASGRIIDCGNSMSPVVERIVKLRPQALFVSPFDGASYGQIDHLGVPLIECADYMETSALGRAEWMRFYGSLMGKEAQADSIFNVVEQSYNKLKQSAGRTAFRPKVLTERVVNGVWYCPGGNSSMGRLLVDAGADYIFATDEHSGSLSLSPEVVITKGSAADYWLFVYHGNKPLSSDDLLNEYAGYKMIKAFRNGKVYQCGASTGTPYFDEISFRPDFLLADFLKIFHPEIEHNAQTRYYKCFTRQH